MLNILIVICNSLVANGNQSSQWEWQWVEQRGLGVHGDVLPWSTVDLLVLHRYHYGLQATTTRLLYIHQNKYLHVYVTSLSSQTFLVRQQGSNSIDYMYMYIHTKQYSVQNFLQMGRADTCSYLRRVDKVEFKLREWSTLILQCTYVYRGQLIPEGCGEEGLKPPGLWTYMYMYNRIQQIRPPPFLHAIGSIEIRRIMMFLCDDHYRLKNAGGSTISAISVVRWVKFEKSNKLR